MDKRFIQKTLKLNYEDIKKKNINLFKKLDSVDTLEAIIKFEKKFKKKLNLNKIFKITSFQKLNNFLNK